MIADMVDKDREPYKPEDFGFHNPERAMEIGPMFLHYRVLPRAGGWDDQLVEDRHDILTFLSLYYRAEWERNSARHRPSRNDDDDGVQEDWLPIMDM